MAYLISKRRHIVMWTNQRQLTLMDYGPSDLNLYRQQTPWTPSVLQASSNRTWAEVASIAQRANGGLAVAAWKRARLHATQKCHMPLPRKNLPLLAHSAVQVNSWVGCGVTGAATAPQASTARPMLPSALHVRIAQLGMSAQDV